MTAVTEPLGPTAPCPACGAVIPAEWNVCPWCDTTLEPRRGRDD